MMDTVVLNDALCKIDVKELQKILCIKDESSYLAEIEMMAAEAQVLARPKIVYKETIIEVKGDNFVVVDGVKLTSQVLRDNMEEALKAFPFVVTCGSELEDWSSKFKDDYFASFCADTIKEMALRSGIQRFETHLEECGLGHAVNMNPGSLTDWPIKEQTPIFELLGNVEELIGVQLTDSYLMLPIKSVSGIRFPKTGTFESCQLCPREKCPSRKALYIVT